MADPAVRPRAGTRDRRLDVFRGIALVTIFVNHVPGNVYEAFTSRNFGFSDAAEAFVLMSGISAGIAYSPAFQARGRALVGSVGRVWRRAWTLYLTHLLITFSALAIAALGAVHFDAPALLRMHGIGVLFRDPLGMLAGIPLLTFQLGYANILPVYVVLLLAAPGMILLALRAPGILLAGSVTLWALAGHWGLSPPTYSGNSWFLNPLTWQILFVVGLLVGIAMRRGDGVWEPLARWRWAALGFVVAALVWREVPAIGSTANHALWLLHQAGVSGHVTAFDKSALDLLRLVHILALLGVVCGFDGVRRAAEGRWADPFALLGRHALGVFALGSVLCYAIQGLRTVTGGGPLADTLMLGSGLAAMVAFAAVRDRWDILFPAAAPPSRGRAARPADAGTEAEREARSGSVNTA